MPRVLQISKTPLVAAPSRIAKALSQHTSWESLHFYEHDYPGSLERTFVADANQVDLKEDKKSLVFKDYATEADVIHIHNQISNDLRCWLRKNVKNARYVYHVHSPVREGPMYLDKWIDFGLPFDRYLAVAQSYPRMYQDFTPVPNIVPWDTLAAPTFSEQIVVLYSPTHRRLGRWGTKVSKALDEALKECAHDDSVKVISLDKPILPNDLFMLRQRANVTIDEITTGGFHMVSLEGLVCGNAVINGADEFSIASFRGCAGTDERPPFVYADPTCIVDVMKDLLKTPEKVHDLQRQSLRYAKSALDPKLLVRKYSEIYYEICA